MTAQMATFLLREGLAEIVGDKLKLTPLGLGTLYRLRYLAENRP